jgi:glycosyltransferase involved in cell wall biosynthesis
MLASRLSGIPYSFTVHGPDEFERATLLSLDVKLKNAAFVNCVSAFGRSQLMRWSPPDLWSKISIVHCGLDAAFFEEPLQPPPQNHRLVCIGRLSPQKGQLVLVAAASRLHDEGLDCEIVFAGDGPMRHQIENSVQQAGLKNQVISTYIAGIPELVRPERTGSLVPAGDEIALAEVMREVLLKVSVDQLARMGLAGRAHVIEHHDCVKEAMKLKRLFEEKPQSCLQKANRPTPGHAKLHH